MSRRQTRSTSGAVLPQKPVAEASLSPPATAGTRNGTSKGKKRSVIEDSVRDSEPLQRTPKRSKRADLKGSALNAGLQKGNDALSNPEDSPVGDDGQELSASVTKKSVALRTKGSDISATATREKKVIGATTNRATKSKDTKETVKEEEEEEEEEKVTVKKQKPAKGKKKKDKESKEMPLAARTTGLKMFIGAHVSAAQG